MLRKLTAAGLVGVAFIGFVPSAEAADPCENRFCVFANMEGRGDRAAIPVGDDEWLGPLGLRDRVTSASNDTNRRVCLVDWRTFMRDPRLCFAPNSYHEDFGRIDYPNGGSWSNKADEVEWD
ncbi:peptidase inhibitor family I36 protein [Streptomyces radicis]|uniref:Peptidase inhibitor family I36 protein n=1 Tax=Streptomyces radicis TaxID=1750517 RepID=A0A3A9WAV3_9ACTN|nr:peptidase inhibitor family I36 protein [Streptomyces radicis]RKN10451.1 hypothetical protein D7319_08425 [Streptomyces radicis]RKN24710.1 hypothetical protein D7318_09600 [Streptomyces radicis]